jgi:hypothetical protein
VIWYLTGDENQVEPIPYTIAPGHTSRLNLTAPASTLTGVSVASFSLPIGNPINYNPIVSAPPIQNDHIRSLEESLVSLQEELDALQETTLMRLRDFDSMMNEQIDLLNSSLDIDDSDFQPYVSAPFPIDSDYFNDGIDTSVDETNGDAADSSRLEKTGSNEKIS